MNNKNHFAFIVSLSVVFMLISSGLSFFGAVNENTAVKIICILISGVLSVLSVFCAVLAITVRDDE